MAQPRRDITQAGYRPGSLRLPYEDGDEGRQINPPSPTDYVLGLEAQVDRMIAAGELPCGPGPESAEAIDIRRKHAKMSPSSVEEVAVSENAVAEKPQVKPSTKKIAKVKAKSPKVRTVLRKKLREKVARESKKHARRSGKPSVREQTCINIPVPLKVKLDQKVKQLGKSRNRIINELVAKLCGWKGLKKIA